MYLDKLANLKAQLQQLAEGTHPEYNKKLKRLDNQHKERLVSKVVSSLKASTVSLCHVLLLCLLPLAPICLRLT